MKPSGKMTALFCVIAIAGCRGKLKAPEYTRYVLDSRNGLKKVLTVDNWDYTFQYKPYDYISLVESGEMSDFEIKKRSQNMRGTAWFNISFKRTDGAVSPLRYQLAAKEEYDKRYNYFLNEAHNDLVLVYNRKDTLHPMSYTFENNFNLTPQETMVVGFELPAGVPYAEKEMQLSYIDQVFKNGIIKVTYTKKELSCIPDLVN